MVESHSELKINFPIYARFGIDGTVWFEKEASIEVFCELAAKPAVGRNKDGLLCCPADLTGKMRDVIIDDGTFFGRRVERTVSRRKSENVRCITALLYDIENTHQRKDDLISKLQATGLTAVIFTTFSHNPEGITNIRHEELAVAGIPALQAQEQCIIDFATMKASKGGFGLKADVSSVQLVDRDRLINDEHCIQLSHERLYRYRVVIFLNGTFGGPGVTDWADLGVQERSRLWHHAYLGFASSIGLDVDRACADLPHASYLPNVHPDRSHTYEWAYLEGQLLDPAKLLKIASLGLNKEQERRTSFANRPVNVHTQLEEVRAALSIIPASCDYREWRNLIWAVKSAFGDTDLEDEACELLDAWSQTDEQLTTHRVSTGSGLTLCPISKGASL